jgi:glycosyltransferase involved in cell wall biosynthesis
MNNEARRDSVQQETPLISIIIPVFNAERYLPECLDSLINQTFGDIEIICVDDASTDRSPEILREYTSRDSRIKALKLKINSRQGAARNLGLQVASAPYIGFVDADDFVAPAYFENLYKAIIRHDADIVITLYKHIDEYGNDWLPHKQNPVKLFFGVGRQSSHGHDWDACMGIGWEQHRDFSGRLKRLGCVNHSMIMNRLYRKNLVGQVRFPEKIRFEDTPFIVEATHRAARIFTTPEGGYCYRRHADSTTSCWDFQKFIEVFLSHKLLDSYIEQATMHDDEREAYSKMLAGNYRYYLKSLVQKLPWLTPARIKEIQALIPEHLHSYLRKRVMRKRLRLALQIAFAILVFFVVLQLLHTTGLNRWMP